MAVQIDEAFEHLAALQATEDLAERGPQIRGIDRFQDVPHLRVAGDAVDPIDGAEVVLGVVAAVVEGQQGRVLERDIAKADIRASSKGISTSPDRRSGREVESKRKERNRASAERAFRASPRPRAIASHSIDPSGIIGIQESIMRSQFAKWEIKTSVFSGRKSQAGNCCHGRSCGRAFRLA